jgi:hypothetical protein
LFMLRVADSTTITTTTALVSRQCTVEPRRVEKPDLAAARKARGAVFVKARGAVFVEARGASQGKPRRFRRHEDVFPQLALRASRRFGLHGICTHSAHV